MGLILIGSISFSIGAAFMKQSQGLTRLGPSCLVVASFVFGAMMLAKSVKTGNVSTVVVIGIGFEVVITMALGILLLGDKVTISQGAGVMLVVGGIALVQR
jgi:small multidrug resistance pump